MLIILVAGSFQLFLHEYRTRNARCDELYAVGERNIDKILLIENPPRAKSEINDYCK